MARVPSFKSLYVPSDIFFCDDDGKMKKNCEISADAQVKCEITFADIEQKNSYMQFSYRQHGKKQGGMEMRQDYAYNVALKKHVKRIENLVDDNGQQITDGAGLVLCQNPGLNDFKLDLFQRICGIRIDDEEATGDLTPGEN